MHACRSTLEDPTDAAESSTRFSAIREPWQFAEYQGQLITTPNYRLYTTVENEDFLDRLPQFYELALHHYTTSLARLPQPAAPLETYLFKTRSQWQLKTQQMLPDQSQMFSNLGRGGFTTRGTSVLYYIDYYSRWSRDTFAIAAHEGWHQYTQQTFKQQLPIWLEEGIATYMEGYHLDRQTGDIEFRPAANFERRETLRDAVRQNKLITLDELLTRTPQSFLNTSKDSLLVYYSQVWALTRFLSEGEDARYRNPLGSVLVDAAEGRLVGRMMSSPVTAEMRRHGGASSLNRIGPVVVQEYFNSNLAEFEAQYVKYIDSLLAEQTRPGR